MTAGDLALTVAAGYYLGVPAVITVCLVGYRITHPKGKQPPS